MPPFFSAQGKLFHMNKCGSEMELTVERIKRRLRKEEIE